MKNEQEEPPKVVLMQCGRKSCSHVLIEDERHWIPDTDFDHATVAVCPKCGNDDFYHLNEQGQILTRSKMENFRDGLDPHRIQPSPRMGLKRRRKIFAAKRRAIAWIDRITEAEYPE